MRLGYLLSAVEIVLSTSWKMHLEIVHLNPLLTYGVVLPARGGHFGDNEA